MKYLYCLIPLVILLVSCSGTEEIPPDSAANAIPAVELIDLSSGGLPLALAVEQGIETNISANWNSAFGRMEITDSDDMTIFIFQDTLTCKTRKEELEGGIFEVSYLIDTDSLIFYKTMLPDGSTPYWHFFGSFMVGGVHYVFENDPLVEVTENQVENMTEIVGNIHPVIRKTN